MKQLKKIILINSLYSYQELDLEGSVHFLGENGTGKTTLLGVVAGFYTGKLDNNYEDSIASTPYHPYKNSWIIYEVQGNKGLFTVAINKSMGNLAFYFINGDYEKEIFREKNKGKSAAKVIESIKLRKLHYFGPVEDVQEYTDILYGNYSGKDKSDLRKYALSTELRTQAVPILLDKLLRGKTLPFSFIKKTLFELEGREGISIDLDKIQLGLKEWKKDQGLLLSLADSKDSSDEVMRYWEILTQKEKEEEELLRLFKPAHLAHKEAGSRLTKAEEEAEKKHQDFSEQTANVYKEQQAELKSLYQRSGELSFKISEAKKKKAYYESPEFLAQYARYEELSYKRILHNAEGIAKKENSQKANKADPGKFAQAYLEASLKKEQELREIQLGTQAKERQLFEQARAGNGSIENDLELYKSADQRIRQKQKELDELAAKRLVLEGQYFYSAEIQQAQKNIYLSLEKSLAFRLELKQGEEKLTSLQKRRETEFAEMDKGLEQQENEILEKLKQSQKDLEALSSQIANSGRAFLGWLEKNYPNWQQSIGKILKDEVLLSPFLNPGIERINDLFYGIHLDLSDLPESELDIAALGRSKGILSEKITSLEKELVKLRKKDQNKRESRERYFRQKHRELKRKAQKDEYELQQLEINRKKWEESIDKFTQQGVQERSAQLLKLSYKEAALHKALKQEVEEFEALEKRIANQKEILEQELDRQKKAIEEQDLAALNKVENKWDKFLVDWEKSKNPKAKTELLEATDLYGWESLQQEILQYHTDKRNFLDQQAFWEIEQKDIQFQIENRETTLFLTHGEMLAQKNELQDVWQEVERARKSWNQTESHWKEIKASTLTKQTNSQQEETEADSISPEPLSRLIPRLIFLRKEKERAFQSLKKNVREFNSHYSADNPFGFSVSLQDDEEVKNSALLIQKFFQEDMALDFEQAAHIRHATLIARIAEENAALEFTKDFLDNRIDRLNQALADEKLSKLLSGSQFAIMPSRKMLFQVLSEIQDFHIQHAQQLGNTSLFNQGDKSSVNTEAFQLLVKLQEALSQYPNMHVSEVDTCEFYLLDRQEKIGDHLPAQSRGSIRFLEVMIGIHLIEELWSAQEAEMPMIHLLLDDLGQLDPKSLAEIQKRAEKANMKLCVASPSLAETKDYDKFYDLELDESQNYLMKSR